MRSCKSVLVILMASVCSFDAFAQGAASLSFVDGKVRLENLDEETLYTFSRYNQQDDWKEVFVVRTVESTDIQISGDYEVERTAVNFAPRYPFKPGVDYVAFVNLEELTKNYNEIYLEKKDAAPLKLEFKIPMNNELAPAVAQIYPSADFIPENILKFHIAFNVPMTRGESLKYVKLYDAHGNEIQKAFLSIDQELWDEDMKVLTLLLDPGRIKRGLRPNQEMGMAFRPGNKYTLFVDARWKSINGASLDRPYVKKFTCLPADRKKPEIEKWKVTTPEIESEALRISLDQSYDWVLLSDAIRIIDSKGHNVHGKIIVAKDESVLLFKPENSWSADDFTILINPLLEDTAGNNVKRLFDEDLNNVSEKNELIRVKFSTKLKFGDQRL